MCVFLDVALKVTPFYSNASKIQVFILFDDKSFDCQAMGALFTQIWKEKDFKNFLVIVPAISVRVSTSLEMKWLIDLFGVRL